MSRVSYDFSGYATKNDVQCGDGRIIRQNAFIDNDQTTVPLVWQHFHDNPENVLGHADLENRSDGVYAYCTFNDTPNGQLAKSQVQHGDITAMSIYANRLVQRGQDVIHGIIREVSLVMAGANPEARIDPLSIAHGEVDTGEEYFTPVDGSAMIFNGPNILVHSDSDQNDEDIDEETIGDVLETLSNKQRKVVDYLVAQALASNVEHTDYDEEYLEHEDDEDSDETIGDILRTFNNKQLKVMEYIVGMARSDAEMNHDDMEEDMSLQHNAFEDNGDVMAHSADLVSAEEVCRIIKKAKDGALGGGSLKHAFEESQVVFDDAAMPSNALMHGIENLDVLYPEAKVVGQYPELISRDMTWVDKVWGAFHKTPFARIKSVAANITAYEARARGYIKGDQKEEEVLDLLSRTTTPTTVYKLQKLDRDDVVDITDIDIIVWMKQEMRVMLNEEIVRAALVGDDRPNSDRTRINPENIRPIYQDEDLYTIHQKVNINSAATFEDIAETIIVESVLSRKNYKGSGQPTMYASTDIITRMLLAKDTLGHRLYRTEAELAAALRVKEIVEVPIFDGITRTASVVETREGATVTTQEERKLLALIVNLDDYSIGTDRKGVINFFDDFDLNFNKYEYLLETRCSGALTRPYAAIAIETTDELPFTYGTISGMYKGSKTDKARQAAASGNEG